MGDDQELERRFTFLKRAAVSDSKHDFYKPNIFNTTRDRDDLKPGFPEVLKGLNTSHHKDIPQHIDTEDEILKLVLPNDSDIGRLKFQLKGLHGKTNNNIDCKGYTQSKYTVKLLHKHGIYDTDRLNTLTLHDLSTFFESDILNLVIDASSLGIMKLITSLKRDPVQDKPYTINILINRETINDPAGKLSEFDKIPEELADKLSTNILIDREPYDIIYSPNSDNLHHTPLQRDKFFSIFEYKMGPVLYKQNQGNNKFKYTKINVDVTHGHHTYHVNDPKRVNTIESCWKLILKAFKAKKEFDASLYFQMKRSGDWLQALSCMDKARQYGNSKLGEINSVKGEITLVTHDRILLAYALFLGIDVIYTNYSDREHCLVYFKNESNPNRQTSIERKQQILEDTIKYLRDSLHADYAFMETYKGWVEQIKTGQIAEINRALSKQNSSENANYFKELLKLIILKTTDVDTLRAELEKLKGNVKDGETNDENIQICQTILSYKSSLDRLKQRSPSKESIEKSMLLARNDPLYKFMVSPTTPMRARRGGGINNTQIVVAVVDAFRSGLPPDIFSQFVQTCRAWKDKYTANDYIIHTIVALLKDDITLENAEPNLQLEALLDIVNGLIMSDTIILEEDGALEEGQVAEAAKMNEEHAPLEEGEVRTLFGFDVSHLAYNVYKDLTRPFEGGGVRHVQKGENVIFYSLLINVYLQLLYSNFNEFDSLSNFDFEVYEELILSIHCLFENEKSAEGRAYILYTQLPRQNGIVGFLAKQLAKHSLGLWDEELAPLPGAQVGMDEVEYNRLVIASKGARDFITRKSNILNMIGENEFEKIEIKEAEPLEEKMDAEPELAFINDDDKLTIAQVHSINDHGDTAMETAVAPPRGRAVERGPSRRESYSRSRSRKRKPNKPEEGKGTRRKARRRSGYHNSLPRSLMVNN